MDEIEVMDQRPATALPQPGAASRRVRPSLRVVVLGLYAAACLAITVAATTGRAGPLLDLVRAIPGGDLAGHFLLVGGLAFVSVVALVGPSDRAGADPASPVGGRQLHRWLWIVSAVVAAVTFDELLQSLFPRRTFSLADFGANLLGVLVFSALALRIRRAKRGTG